MYEAMPETGVSTVSITEFFSRYAYVAVYTQPVMNSKQEYMQQATKFAQSKLLTKYDRAAVLLPWRQTRHLRNFWSFPPKMQSGRREKTIPMLRNTIFSKKKAQPMFCSAFVMETLRASRVPGIDDDYFTPRMWGPTMLAEENHLLGFKGYLVRNGYIDISPHDPMIAGNPQLLERWQNALEHNDTEVLNSFSHMKSEIKRKIYESVQAKRQSSNF